MALTPKSAATPAELREALTAVDEAMAGTTMPAPARNHARSRAQTLYAACGPEGLAIVRLGYATELLSIIAVDLAAAPAEAERLITRLADRAGVPRVALGCEVLQTGGLLGLPINVAIEVRLALLAAFTGAHSVALWMLGARDELELLSHAGAEVPDTRVYMDATRRLLVGSEPPRAGPEEILGVRLERLRPPRAALVCHGIPAGPEQAELLLGAAVPVLSSMLDREVPLGRDSLTQDAVLGSVERRLARLRFDLHDGPQQDVHLLAQDLALFREQVRPMIADNPNAGRLLGRLDDLEAQLVALDGDLRRLSSAVQSPLLTSASLPEALRTVTDAFATRTGIEPEIRFSGKLTNLTDSQQIALLSLIRESLSNIRKHSSATHVAIVIAADEQGVRAEVRDNGDGFDPEETLVRAAQAGRMGLVGMHERVRMLGGRTQIDSRPGGPTVISATLPPWPAEETRPQLP